MQLRQRLIFSISMVGGMNALLYIWTLLKFGAEVEADRGCLEKCNKTGDEWAKQRKKMKNQKVIAVLGAINRGKDAGNWKCSRKSKGIFEMKCLEQKKGITCSRMIRNNKISRKPEI